MKKLSKDKCGRYSASRGAICPSCDKPISEDGLNHFYVPIYEQNIIGYSDPLWPHFNDLAAIFECPHCFENYWFHLADFVLDDFKECQEEYFRGKYEKTKTKRISKKSSKERHKA